MKMRSIAIAAASTALVFSAAGPAMAGGDGGRGGHGGLEIHPSSGGPGTHVEVKAHCKDGGHGTVASDAFESSQAHTNQNTGSGQNFATAKVMHHGLKHGKKYEVTGYCKDHTKLTGHFTFTGVGGAAHAGLGGLAGGGDSGTSTTTTAATAAGGVAAAGIAGYLFILRRRANADQA